MITIIEVFLTMLTTMTIMITIITIRVNIKKVKIALSNSKNKPRLNDNGVFGRAIWDKLSSNMEYLQPIFLNCPSAFLKVLKLPEPNM